MEPAQRFAILWCEDSESWAGQEQSFVSALSERKDETWEVFKAFEGKFPEIDQLHKYTGMCCTRLFFKKNWEIFETACQPLHPPCHAFSKVCS